MNLRLCIFLCALALLAIIISAFAIGGTGKYQMIADRGADGTGILILNTQNSELTACRFSSNYIYNLNFLESECANLDVIRRVEENREWTAERKKRIEEDNKKTPNQKEKELIDEMDKFLRDGGKAE